MPASYLLVVTIEVRTDALKISLSRRPHLPGLCVLQGVRQIVALPAVLCKAIAAESFIDQLFFPRP